MKKIRNLVALLANGQFHSGQSLGEALGVTRSAVWKMMRRLPEFGLQVKKQQGKGYCLPHPIELLEQSIIEQQLSAENKEKLSQMHLLNITDSTNSFLHHQLSETPGAVATCLAEFQTAGRGRLGRQWVSPYATNIAFSLSWRFDKDLTQLYGLSLSVAVAVRRALIKYGVPEELGVKWPNDLLWKGAKLAGVLLELKAEPHVSTQVVIGVGVNLQPLGHESAEYEIASIAEILPGVPRRNELTGLILNELISALTMFEQQGFQAFIEDWRECDSMRDKQVRLVTPKKEYAGVVKGISETGELLIAEQDDVRAFATGEVSVRVTEPEPVA